ncbi:MAG TPA: ECF transporter S component [bacterium]|nr:ECF transporter S component [bacterium]HPN33464.1 ECF transporter S component [bacterium]
MLHVRNRHIALSGLFVALGLMLPALFHAVGLGSLFLPMFWPVALAGFFLPWPFAAAIAVLTPVLSSLLTGMPPVSPPILHLMVAELVSLALVVSLLYQTVRWNLFWILLAGLAVSRLVCFLAARMLAEWLGLPAAWSALAMVVKGVPGIMGMLLFLPLLARRLKQETLFSDRNDHV